MRLVFMGTPDIAASMLRRIAGEQEVCGLFCQPDKPVGRKAVLTPPAAKIAAEALGIPVFQPVKMRDGVAAGTLAGLRPELVVVVAYGRLLPPEMLAIPPRGCLNIHVSLLPRYRGAAPIQHALLNGETETGVTAMWMDEGLDTGDILAQRAFSIAESDDAATLFARSAELGGELLAETLRGIESGEVVPVPQDGGRASYAPALSREMSAFSFGEDARRIVDKIRALCIWPVASFKDGEREIKVLKACFAAETGVPGSILSLDPLTVAAKGGSVILYELKPAGGRQMKGREYAMGRRFKAGDFIQGEKHD